MKENSREEDIRNTEHFVNSIINDKSYDETGWHGYDNAEIVELAIMLEHILSDYKRVLKENEKLGISNKYTIHLTDKQYNEVIENAQNDINQKWIQKVKDKIEEMQKDLDLDNETEIALNNQILDLQRENEKYKRLAEMNLENAEEFKNNMCEHRCLLKSENEELKESNKVLEELLQGNLYELYKYYKELAGIYQGNCISIQKVKEKIEKLNKKEKEELKD